MVWIETPSNPLLRITDIEAIAAAAHAAGAIVVADNTFLSPAGQSPLELGADIVLHSTTKYINGHSDVVGGAVIAKDPAQVEELAWWANCLGLTGSPFDSFQTLRGLRTLNVRYKKHEENAAAVAEFLDAHPLVGEVYFPGLKSHPGHETAARQQKSFGAMISFEVAGRAIRNPALHADTGTVHAGRITGWRGEPGRAPGHHDPRGHVTGRPGSGRYQFLPVASVDRH